MSGLPELDRSEVNFVEFLKIRLHNMNIDVAAAGDLIKCVVDHLPAMALLRSPGAPHYVTCK